MSVESGPWDRTRGLGERFLSSGEGGAWGPRMKE